MSLESLLPTSNTQYVVTLLGDNYNMAIEANFFDSLESAREHYLFLVNEAHCVQLSEFKLMSHNEIMESV